MALVFLGVGSNLGDRQANIDKAVGLVKELEDTKVLAVSSWIETEAIGGPPQGKFLNGAIKIDTDILPLELLSRLKGIERRLGRPKNDIANSPRTIDLDILFYNDVVIVDGKNLTIPHPKLAERLFVLQPLLEIAPDMVHPRLNKTVKDLYESLVNGQPLLNEDITHFPQP